MKNIYILFALLLQLFTVKNAVAQCFAAPNGQWPTAAFTPTCAGTCTIQNITTAAWTGEYSVVNVVAGNTYTFRSSVTTHYITISNSTGTTAFAFGVGGTAGITWVSTITGTVRFYTHLSSACNSNTTNHTRRVCCVGAAPPPYNPCTTIPTIAGCGTSVTAAMTGTGAGWSVTSCGYPTPGQERLFQFTAPTTGTYTLNVSAITGGFVDFFWKPASGGCNATGWNCIDDIFTTGVYSAIAPMNFTAGTTYYILLDPETTGTFNTTFNLVCPAAAVANDLVCNATAISCGQTLNGTTVGANNAGTGENLTCGTPQTMPGVWYVVPGNGQIMTASLCGTVWDSKISVFNGTNCATLTCVGGIDDAGPACATTSASFSWTSVVGQNYYILVHGYVTNQAFALALTCTNPCPTPPNDLCANAPILNLGTNNNQTHVGTGCGSTPNLGTYKDVWVAFTVPCGGMNIAIDFCGSTPVHNNAYLNISPDCSFATFTSAANWDFTSCPDGNIRLYWNNVPAGTYYYPILIDPAWETNYTLNISGTPLHTPATAPTSISGTTTICGGQSTTLTLQGGSAGTNGTVQWFEGSCGSAVIGTANSITVAPTTNTTYFVRYISSCNTTACASVSVNLNSASTEPTLSGAGLICPNTTVNLVASGGTAGTGSQVAWYTGPNGTGSFLGFGNSFSFLPTASSIVYARREGTCNTTVDASTSITLRDYVYAANNISSTNYCTDNAGWNHFYNGNDIILSVRGNLSSAGTVTALINDNANYFSALGNTALCASGINPGEAQFEMQRSWNVSYTGTLSGTYEVRYYFNPQERQDVIDAAAAYLAANPSCAYTYKYNASNSGWFWFKNNNVTYTAPSFDDNPNFALLTSTVPGSTPNGLTYTEISNITGFSGGTGGVVLLPGGFLPVEWLYFNAENQGNANRLLWATASEENALSFDVERSKDGSNFEKIGTKTAAGNSSVTNYYEFMDNNPQNGFNYYRIKLINTDGTEEFTEVKVLENKFSSDDFAVYPNPSSDIIHFNSTADKAEDMKVEVLDILGRVVKTEIHKSVIGKNNVPLRIAELQAGAYSLRVTFLQSNRTNSAKFVKK